MSAARLLLGSGGLSTEPRREAWRAALRDFLPASVQRLCFVPFALAQHDAYVERIEQLDFAGGRRLDGLHRAAEARAALEAAQAVYVGGGNTFRLLDRLQRMGVLGLLRERVRAGMPYIGISAGTNVACPTIRTTNDMPIVQPVSLDALGLVPFQVNPHWFDGPTFVQEGGGYRPYGGETRDDRLREFLEENARPVLAIAEGGILRVEGASARLLAAPARLFRRGQAPQDLAPGTDLSALMGA
ncbi:MAG: dipeptidase PepE [Planctomycetia bacterium]